MIKIELPPFDFDVTIKEVKEIPYSLGGVYIIYDKDDVPLYVGKAGCLRSRIHAHFRGAAGNNTQRWAWAFSRIKAIIEEDSASKNVYECYFINFLKPCLNRNINPYKHKGANLTLSKADPENLLPGYCQFILDNQTQCSHRPHLNGYCGLHGGNGVSRQSFIDRAIEDYEKLVDACHSIK